MPDLHNANERLKESLRNNMFDVASEIDRFQENMRQESNSELFVKEHQTRMYGLCGGREADVLLSRLFPKAEQAKGKWIMGRYRG